MKAFAETFKECVFSEFLYIYVIYGVDKQCFTWIAWHMNIFRFIFHCRGSSMTD